MSNAANIMSGSPWVGSLCALNWGNDIRYRNGDVCYEPEKAVLFLNMATMRSFSSLPFDVLLRVFRELDIVGLIAFTWNGEHFTVVIHRSLLALLRFPLQNATDMQRFL